MTNTPIVDDLKSTQDQKDLREGIAAAKKWMTEENMKWVAKFPNVAKLVVHPVALMAYSEDNRVAGFQAPAPGEDPRFYKPKIAGLPCGILLTIQRNQIILCRPSRQHTLLCFSVDEPT